MKMKLDIQCVVCGKPLKSPRINYNTCGDLKCRDRYHIVFMKDRRGYWKSYYKNRKTKLINFE